MKLYISLLAFLFGTVGLAQDININKGDFELKLASAFDQGQFNVDAHFGAFVADYTQWRLDVGYTDTDFFTQSRAGVTALRFFETRTYTIPYVGLGLGYTSVDSPNGLENTGAEFSLILGLRYYLAENVALSTELKTAYATDDAYIDGTSVTDTDYRLGIGLSYLW